MEVSKTSRTLPGPCKGASPLTGPRREEAITAPPLLADLLPNPILSGVLQGLYLPLGCAPSQAGPRASGMMSSQTPTQHPGMLW